MRRLPHLLTFLSLLLFFPALSARTRKAKHLSPIRIDVPEGNAPTLPFRLWTGNDKGRGQWQQTRWTNWLRSEEEREAALPAGTSYTVEGFLLGHTDTAEGLPISARVSVVSTADTVPSPVPVAHPLPLGDVQLIGDNRLTRNRDLDIRTILSWDIAQQLYNYRDTYGLPTEGYPEADGWDSPTTKLKGHGTGHYMSALALALASAQDEDTRQQLRQRLRRMVDELRQCQERTFVWIDSLGRYREARDLAPEDELREMKATWADFDRYKRDCTQYGYGYLNAIPAQHVVLTEMYRPYNNEEWLWAPYYTIHKQLAGLIDIACLADEPDVARKALLIAKDMGLWVWNRLHYRTYLQTEGTQEERRQRPGNRYEMWNMYIAGEVGGMGEALARLAEMVDDRTDGERLLQAAGYFDAPAFFRPLARGIDDLRTRHANQHIPMITGALRLYRSTADADYYRIARNFWHHVQGRYAYATGGVGNGEMFRQPYAQVIDEHINETCCAYYLAKLTRDLNAYTPDDACLMDYYERLLYNQLVGSLHPNRYAVTYQYALGLNAAKPFGNETPQSTCCGGTGAENHVRYQEAAYFASDSTLWVCLYLPTEARWRAKGVSLRQECTWPAEQTTITLHGGGRFALRLRVPYWATAGFTVTLNGRIVVSHARPSSYVELPSRQWADGDRIEIRMPFAPHVHFHPDPTAAPGQPADALGAIMLGPLVMATPDAPTWEQASAAVHADLRELRRDSSPEGLPRLTLGSLSFLPDYSFVGPSTHYLRLTLLGRHRRHRSADTAGDQWSSLLQVADERRATPDAWAPNGYRRMLQAIDAADPTALKSALNTMRPAHLAEPEDLAPLLSLLHTAEQTPAPSTRLSAAISHARMVVQYVTDGSGTPDLIEKAVQQLRNALSNRP